MTMRAWLTTSEGKRIKLKIPPPDSPAATAEIPCACGSFLVNGLGASIEDRDTYVADAVCYDCRAARGKMRVVVDTIFGIEEDERVLNGRARVYYGGIW